MQIDDAMLARLRDPATPPEELEDAWFENLAEEEAMEIYEAIASNPNISPKILAEAAFECPDLVLANPVLPLLAIEDPLLSFIPHLDLRILFEMHQFASDEMRVILDAAWAERKRRYGYITGENQFNEIVTEERAFFVEGIRLTPDHILKAVEARMLRRRMEGK